MFNQTVVLDAGSGICKGGFAGENRPRSSFSSAVGRDKRARNLDTFVGADAQAKRDVLSLNYPIKRGHISHWYDMQKLWDYTFQTELEVNIDGSALLLTEHPFYPVQTRQKTTTLMFESYDFPALFFANHAALALYSTGRITGLVLDSGCGITNSVPVHDGYSITRAMKKLELAGCDLDTYMLTLLSNRGYFMATSSMEEFARDIKENLSYVAKDYAKEVKKEKFKKRKVYSLPDGKTIEIGEERLIVAESLFSPTLCGKDSDGVIETMYNSIMKCQHDLRKTMYSNIILSGGTTMLPGFQERVEDQIPVLAPAATTINVVAPHDRTYASWIGGSILASLSTFKDMVVTKDEYFEVGPSIVHRKCC